VAEQGGLLDLGRRRRGAELLVRVAHAARNGSWACAQTGTPARRSPTHSVEAMWRFMPSSLGS
jgi:hypothetical protein